MAGIQHDPFEIVFTQIFENVFACSPLPNSHIYCLELGLIDWGAIILPKQLLIALLC